MNGPNQRLLPPASIFAEPFTKFMRRRTHVLASRYNSIEPRTSQADGREHKYVGNDVVCYSKSY